MKRQKLLYIILFSLIFQFNLFAEDKKTIAVLDLIPHGLSNTESRIITSRLRTDLFNSNHFIVLERDKMENILNEQGFQLSSCKTNECIIEAGQLLGVQQMVAGEIGKIGELITVTIRLIDIETGIVLKTATEDCKCKIEKVLTGSIKKVVKKLTGKSIKSDSYLNTKSNSIKNSKDIPQPNEIMSLSKQDYYLYDKNKKSMGTSVIASILMPGAGLYYVGNYGKGLTNTNYLRGIIYSISYVASIIAGSSMNDDKESLGWILGGGGGAQLLSLIDVIITTNDYNENLLYKLKFGYKIDKQKPSINLCYYF